MSLDLSWQEGAPCGADPELFFGDEDEPADTRERREAAAIAICKGPCGPRRVKCLAFHLNAGQNDGVAGGIGPRDRFLMRRNLMRAYPGEEFSLAAVEAVMVKADLLADAPEGMKRCAGPCGQFRPRVQFGPRKRGGYKYASCDSCRAQARKEMAA